MDAPSIQCAGDVRRVVCGDRLHDHSRVPGTARARQQRRSVVVGLHGVAEERESLSPVITTGSGRLRLESPKSRFLG